MEKTLVDLNTTSCKPRMTIVWPNILVKLPVEFLCVLCGASVQFTIDVWPGVVDVPKQALYPLWNVSTRVFAICEYTSYYASAVIDRFYADHCDNTSLEFGWQQNSLIIDFQCFVWFEHKQAMLWWNQRRIIPLTLVKMQRLIPDDNPYLKHIQNSNSLHFENFVWIQSKKFIHAFKLIKKNTSTISFDLYSKPVFSKKYFFLSDNKNNRNFLRKNFFFKVQKLLEKNSDLFFGTNNMAWIQFFCYGFV